MDDNLLNDPSDQNKNQPPPFGSDFKPNTNPINAGDPNLPPPPQDLLPETPNSQTLPNNPPILDPTPNLADPVQSWVAKHEKRDAHGRFIKSEHTVQDTPDQANTSLPDPIHITHTDEYHKVDPPLIDVKVTNPVTYLKLFLKRLLNNEGIDFRLRIRPLTAIAIGLAFATFFAGTGFSISQLFFPNSSPILKRAVTFQGTIKKTDMGVYYLNLSDNSLYRLTPKSNNDDYNALINRQVMVKGNLTREPNVIDVSEINSFDTR